MTEKKRHGPPSRRALMLTNADSEIQRLALTIKERGEKGQEEVDAMHDAIRKRVEAIHAEQNADIERVKARIKEIGVLVLDAANHEISVSPDEGVVWLEPKNDCSCPFCRGAIIILGR